VNYSVRFTLKPKSRQSPHPSA